MVKIAKPTTVFEDFVFGPILAKLLEARANKREYTRSYTPKNWQPNEPWFWVSTACQCILWNTYELLGFEGLPKKAKDVLRLDVGTNYHWLLERLFGPFAIAKEVNLIDRRHRLRGRADMLVRGVIAGELAVVDFKTREPFPFGLIKREGLPDYLRDTPFYPADPASELQVMLYIYMFRQMVRDIMDNEPEELALLIKEGAAKAGVSLGKAVIDSIVETILPRWELPLRYGLVIYANLGVPGQFKTALVEYDPRIVERFLAKLAEARQALKRGRPQDPTNNPPIQPYLAKESHICGQYCPMRHICPRGQEAMAWQGPRKDIPLWKIFELRRRHKMTRDQVRLAPAQSDLFATPLTAPV